MIMRWQCCIVSIPAVLAPALAVGAAANDVLWDNGDTNGVNGISHLTDPYRSVLDDFVVPDDSVWRLSRFTTLGGHGGFAGKLEGFDLHIWSNDPEVPFWNEAGPGDVLATLSVLSADVTRTGRRFFNRDEMLVWVEFDEIELAPGRYWLEMHIQWPRNWFQFAKDGDLIRDNPMWLMYTDFGSPPAFPGREIFGVDYDVAWTFSGTSAELARPDTFDHTGELLSGGIAELADSDDAYVVIRNRAPPSPLEPSIEIVVEGETAVATPTDITFTAEASCTAFPPAIPQHIELYDFEAGGWVTLDERFATRTDSTVEVVVEEGAACFVETGTGRLRARVRWFNSGATILPDWRANIDLTVWKVGRPVP